MSRAINIDAAEQHVRDTCGKLDAAITSIEALRSGGIRVVLQSGDGAANVRRAYGAKVLTGPVRRDPTRLRHD